MTEIGTCKETVVTAGTHHKPTGIGTPVMERLRILGVGPVHQTTLPRGKVKQPEICLMMPDAELPVVRQCVTKEPPIIGRTGEGDGLLL